MNRALVGSKHRRSDDFSSEDEKYLRSLEAVRDVRRGEDNNERAHKVEQRILAEAASRSKIFEEQLGVPKEAEPVLYHKSEVLEMFINETQNLIDIYKQNELNDERCRRGLTMEEVRESRAQTQKMVCLGDLRYREFLGHIANLKMRRFGPQMEVVRAASASLIRQFFEKDFEVHLPRIEREYGQHDFRTQLLVSMPRRNGKTEISAAIEAGAMKVRGGNSYIFGKVLRQSQDMLKLVKKRIIEMSDGDESVIVVDNSKMISYSPTGSKANGKIAGSVFALSGAASDNARGFTALRIYVDEASFVDDEFVKKNLFAGMLIKDVFVMMISSPPTSTTHIFSRMCNATFSGDGSSVFKRISIESMCAACKKRGDMLQCPHSKHGTPEWLNGSETRRILEEVLGKFDPTTYRQEILGIMEDQDVDVFPGVLLEHFKNEERIRFEHPPSLVLVGVDTSGGGDSETAICAMARDANENYVVSCCCCLSSSWRNSPA